MHIYPKMSLFFQNSPLQHVSIKLFESLLFKRRMKIMRPLAGLLGELSSTIHKVLGTAHTSTNGSWMPLLPND